MLSASFSVVPMLSTTIVLSRERASKYASNNRGGSCGYPPTRHCQNISSTCTLWTNDCMSEKNFADGVVLRVDARTPSEFTTSSVRTGFNTFKCRVSGCSYYQRTILHA